MNGDQIYKEYKSTTQDDMKNFKVQFVNSSTTRPTTEGTYTFDHTKTGTVAVTSDIITSYNDLTDKPTIPDTTHMVTDNTDQNITATKTFRSTNSLLSQYYSIINHNGVFAYDDMGNTSVQGQGITTADSTTGTARTNFFGLNGINIRYDDASASIDDFLIRFSKSGQSTPQAQYTFRPNKTGEVAITSEIPIATSDLTNDSGFITGITSSMVTNALGYTPGTSNFSGSYNDLSNKPSIPSSASSTSTVTPTTSGFVTSTTKTTETLTFTYSDNTTANITIVTSVTDNTSNAMTGASVSTTTTLS